MSRRRLGRWRNSDTALVVLAFALPLLSGVVAVLLFDRWTWGAWTTIEADWTAWAVIGLGVALYKAGLLAGDIEAAHASRRGWRYAVGGWWILANTLGFGLAFAAWAIVGLVAGQLPPADIRAGSVDVPASLVSGGLFMLVEAALIGVMVFGLVCRIRLAE